MHALTRVCVCVCVCVCVGGCVACLFPLFSEKEKKPGLYGNSMKQGTVNIFEI